MEHFIGIINNERMSCSKFSLLKDYYNLLDIASKTFTKMAIAIAH